MTIYLSDKILHKILSFVLSKLVFQILFKMILKEDVNKSKTLVMQKFKKQ